MPAEKKDRFTWQNSLILISFFLSGIVAFKVLMPKKNGNGNNNGNGMSPEMMAAAAATMMQRQYMMQQYMNQNMVGGMGIPQYDTGGVPMIEGGSPVPNLPPVSSNGNGGGYNANGGPPLSSHAEKMIYQDQLQKIPVHQMPVGGPQMQPQPQPQQQYPHQQIHRQVPIHSYRPQIPTIPQVHDFNRIMTPDGHVARPPPYNNNNQNRGDIY